MGRVLRLGGSEHSSTLSALLGLGAEVRRALHALVEDAGLRLGVADALRDVWGGEFEAPAEERPARAEGTA